MEHQITHAPQNHLLTNTGVWTCDGESIVYDIRSDPAGSCFDGLRIEAVHADSGQVSVIHQSCRGACCGVVTCHPKERKVIFIEGPENPTSDWSYQANHRQGIIASMEYPGQSETMDARDLTPPFTPGALRGGTHVHVWDAAGDWISFTYNDALVDPHIRDVGISIPRHRVTVTKDHPRNHDGSHFSLIISRTQRNPRPGSDEIQWAGEEGWIGRINSHGKPSPRSLAFQGHVVSQDGNVVSEVYLGDLPDSFQTSDLDPNLTNPHQRPAPPLQVHQRRLTYTAQRKYPGIQGPRHWLRSAPDGSAVACLMKDDAGIVQIWCVRLPGGDLVPLTRNRYPIASAFSWSPDGKWIAHVMDRSVCLTDAVTGETHRLTKPGDNEHFAPRPEACVFSPDSRKVAYLKPVLHQETVYNQVFCAFLP